MRLTDEEQRMYHGERGPTVAQAMDYLVRFGEACDSDSMVDISYAHVNPGRVGGLSDIHEVPELAEAGARVVIPTSTTVVGTDLEQWQLMETPEEAAQQQISAIPAHKKMGIAGTYSCTPYLLGYLPPKGAHIASVESSAVIYFNSMLGARTNRDGPFAIYAALTGKYPLCGYHLDENRKGTHLIRVETKLTGPTDYGALGFCIGEMVGGGVPVITGLTSPRQEELIAMGAAMATSGYIALYHIPGVTAECRTPEDVFVKGASYDEFSIDTVRIEEMRKHRWLYRQQRRESGIPIVALVGYTNAGKSTLLNALSQADVFVEDKLFATLDPTTRRLTLPDKNVILLTDTVGFIRKLPPTIVTAFRATLEELPEASILLHVVDLASHSAPEQCQTVEDILADLNLMDKPRITALNKIDLLLDAGKAWDEESAINYLSDRNDVINKNTVLISAEKKWGLNKLLETLSRRLSPATQPV